MWKGRKFKLKCCFVIAGYFRRCCALLRRLQVMMDFHSKIRSCHGTRASTTLCRGWPWMRWSTWVLPRTVWSRAASDVWVSRRICLYLNVFTVTSAEMPPLFHSLSTSPPRSGNLWLTFGTVYLTMLSCLIQLTRLNPGLINFGNITILFMIWKPIFMEPKVGVVIRY